MKAGISIAIMAILLVACEQTAGSLEPIPGSITYGGQPRTKLTKAPIGSQVPHRFTDQWGDDGYETYIIQPARSLKLTDRRIVEQSF
jgi:hypothetical protein